MEKEIFNSIGNCVVAVVDQVKENPTFFKWLTISGTAIVGTLCAGYEIEKLAQNDYQMNINIKGLISADIKKNNS